MLNSIRFRFARGEEVKFISHLDLMKVFERALRRSGLPIAYSQGFNPHPQMVFGLPLSVGVTSESEYADFELTQELDPAEFVTRLNDQLPPGFHILDAGSKTAKGNIMADIQGAIYEVQVFFKEPVSLDAFKEKVSAFMSRSSVIVKKETKSGVRDTDIRPMVYSLDAAVLKEIPAGYESFAAAFRLEAFLSAGSAANLKPELLTGALFEPAGWKPGAVRIHRKELFVRKDGKWMNPLL